MTNTMKIPELLAPAGSLDKLKVAIYYGADAVYMGGSRFSLRAHAVLSDDVLEEAVRYAHEHDVKVYVTINIMAHNQDLAYLTKYLTFLRDIKVDGLIISDPGIFNYARKVVPDIPVHLSTQANITNKESARFWQTQGVRRINLARELSLPEIKEVRGHVSVDLEVFVHGAICISYSGRCSLSLYLTGRDANQGNCAHPCRYRYQLQEEKRPGQFLPVEEDGRGTYIFNSKDLCLLNRLPELMEAGVDSFKIEGRMKSIYYVGATVRLYRSAINYIQEQYEMGIVGPEKIVFPAVFKDELHKIGSRGYTENFADGPPSEDQMLYMGVRDQLNYTPVGVVRQQKNNPIIEVRSQFKVGDQIEYLNTGTVAPNMLTVEKLIDKNGDMLEIVNPGNVVELVTSPAAKSWQVNGLFRKKKE